MKDKEYWIRELDLIKHPEGGYYKEIYRSQESINVNRGEQNCKRSLITSIFFLLTSKNFSAFHRIKSDELWHFHDGDAITIHSINKHGELTSVSLGKNIENGERLQHVVNAGDWFASEVKKENAYALVGCTVAPGFDFNDFELASSELKNTYSEHSQLIERLTIA